MRFNEIRTGKFAPKDSTRWKQTAISQWFGAVHSGARDRYGLFNLFTRGLFIHEPTSVFLVAMTRVTNSVVCRIVLGSVFVTLINHRFWAQVKKRPTEILASLPANSTENLCASHYTPKRTITHSVRMRFSTNK